MLFILSRVTLLILPILDFEGLTKSAKTKTLLLFFICLISLFNCSWDRLLTFLNSRSFIMFIKSSLKSAVCSTIEGYIKNEPYRKQDNHPVWICVNSNHPPTTTRQLPTFFCKKLSELWCNVEKLKKVIPRYNEALKKLDSKRTCYMHLKLTKNNFSKKQRKCIWFIWFNPPYSVNVKTNIG